MRSTLVLLVCSVLVGCGTATPSPGLTSGPGSLDSLPTLAPPPIDLAGVPSNVHVDQAKAAASWIGPAGGTLTATAADGTAYVLDIPEYAVRDATAITMTPITGVDALGLSGGLAGAVYLQPAGLALAVPATLTITTSKSAPAGTRLVGFDVPDGGGSADLVPASGGGTVSVAVFHFSAPGAGFGTSQDLQAFGTAPSGRLAGALSQLLAFDVPWDGTDQAIAQAGFQVAWSQIVEPDLRGAANDADFLRAIRDWSTVVFIMNLILHNGDVTAALAEGSAYPGGASSFVTAAYLGGLGIIGTKVAQALDGNKALCVQSRDLHALANVWFWAGIGERYAPVDRDWQAAARGCAELAVGVANLPTSLTANGSGSLGLTFVLKFSDGTQVPADVEATLQGSGFTFAASGGATTTARVAGTSTLTAGVFATQAPPYSLGVRVCWFLDGIARTLCSTLPPLPFGSGPTQPPQSAAPAASGAIPDFSGLYDVQLTCGPDVYGNGLATVTATGLTITVTWSVTMVDTLATSGGLCGDAWRGGRFPTSGSYSGQLTRRSAGLYEIELASWTATPCLSPQSAPAKAPFWRNPAILIPIGACAPGPVLGSTLYQAYRQ